MHDPATQEYWTQCGCKPCMGTWGSPAGYTEKYWYNFSNPAAVEWWLNVYIGEALHNPLFDAIYFDRLLKLLGILEISGQVSRVSHQSLRRKLQRVLVDRVDRL